jgi:hypothetical protein
MKFINQAISKINFQRRDALRYRCVVHIAGPGTGRGQKKILSKCKRTA